jgi:hypothetical protein
MHLMARFPSPRTGVHFYVQLHRKSDGATLMLANVGAESTLSLGVWC